MMKNISLNLDGNVRELLSSYKKGHDEHAGKGVPENVSIQTAMGTVDIAKSTNLSASNMMERNFASFEREDSKYMKAHKAGQDALSKQANRQNAILSAGIAELNALPDEQKDSYAIRNLMGRKAARRMLQEGQQSAQEESEKNLKEIKDDIEDRAKEATAPTDENGNPIEGQPTAGSGEATPVPEASGSNPAPTPEVPEPQAPGVAAAPVPVIATPTPASPTPSINIRV